MGICNIFSRITETQNAWGPVLCQTAAQVVSTVSPKNTFQSCSQVHVKQHACTYQGVWSLIIVFIYIFYHDLSFIIPLFFALSTSYAKKKKSLKEFRSHLRLCQGFSPPLFVWNIAHFAVMGNKMWFHTCCRTWLFLRMNLGVSHPTFAFGFFIMMWIVDGFSEATCNYHTTGRIYDWN